MGCGRDLARTSMATRTADSHPRRHRRLDTLGAARGSRGRDPHRFCVEQRAKQAVGTQRAAVALAAQHHQGQGQDGETDPNVEPCQECSTRTRARCPHIGTLHACVRDEGGSWRSLEIPNVRYADQPDSLLSVDQLWEDLNLDVTFRNVRCVVGPHGTRFPFVRGTANGDNPGLPEWHMQLSAKATSSTSPRPLKIPRALKAVIHRGHTSSHIGHLSAERAGAAMHRRLHIGVRRLRRLAALTADAPMNLALAPEYSCPFCVEANGTKLPHTGSRYQASRPGRLIHADMVGPFKQSSRGNHYAVVLVDDHSRFKFVYPMKRKSDLKAK